MIELTNVYRCICEKCKYEWTAKDATIPATCAKCRSTKWNTQSEPATQTLVERVKQLSTAKRLELFEHFELCCGMNRGACICEAETPKPSQTIQPEKKTILEALQAKIDGVGNEPKAEIVEDVWIEMPTTKENGETLYWHRKIKGSPVCYKRETDWDTFA